MEKYLKFDQRTWFEVLNKISFIEMSNSRWHFLSKNKGRCLELLQKKALAESIISAMKLCGIRISQFDAEKIIKNQFNTPDREEQKKAFFYMESHKSADYKIYSTKLTEPDLFGEYHNLLGLKVKGSQRRSVYRKPWGKNDFISKRENSDNKTTPSIQKVIEKELSNILDWTNRSLEEKIIHPLLVIATFIYRFISLQPFKDANEQLSNLLTYLLLRKTKYHFIKYYSLESIICQNLEVYEELKSRIRESEINKENLMNEWTLFFLCSIENLINQLDSRYEFYQQNLRYLNERQKELLNVIEDKGPVKFADIADSMEDYSVNTLKKDLQLLLKENYIEAFGKNKGMVYIKV